ncbi:MAG: MFS transporter [Candidatus Heimdallarchaeota archaeon]|nr:MFS transporter [Candidatus Heimdallarchaeota archaeon]
MSEEKVTPTERIIDQKGISWKNFLQFYLVIAALFLVMFTMRSTVTIFQVFVPDMSYSFDVSEGTIATLFTIYNLSAAVVSLVIGPLADKLGFKVMIFSGMFIFASAVTISTFTTEFWMMASSQTLAGIGAAFFGPANIAYAGDYFPKERRTSAIGVIMSSFYVGSIVAVPINSYVADLLDWRWGIRIMGLFSFFVFIVIIFAIPCLKKRKSKSVSEIDEEKIQEFEKNKAQDLEKTLEIDDTIHDEKSYFQRMGIVLSNKYAIGTFFITLFQRGGLFAMTTLLSTWLVKKFNINTTKIGLIFMGAGVAALVSNTLFSWIAGKIGKRKVILIGTGLTTIWIGIFPLISPILSVAIFNIILLNFFGGISMGSYNTFVTEVSNHSKGTTLAINNTFGQISQAATVALLGKLIYDFTGEYIYCGFTAMGIYIVCFILMFIFIRPKIIDERNKLTNFK